MGQMVNRIRNVRPQFFKHERLQELEEQHPALKPMLVYAGLWCHSDKRGVFVWRPKLLGLEILPFLSVDIAACLELLEQYGFIRKFTAPDGETYGVVIKFVEHQALSKKEKKSDAPYPEPPTDPNVRTVPGPSQRSPRTVPEQSQHNTGTLDVMTLDVVTCDIRRNEGGKLETSGSGEGEESSQCKTKTCPPSLEPNTEDPKTEDQGHEAVVLPPNWSGEPDEITRKRFLVKGVALLDRCGIHPKHSTANACGDCIRFLSRENGLSPDDADAEMERRVMKAKEMAGSLPVKWDFWFADGDWREQVPKGKSDNPQGTPRFSAAAEKLRQMGVNV